MRKNIIVSNRLPVNVTKLEKSFLFQSSSGGLATGLKSIHQKTDSLWIGWSGLSDDDLNKKNRAEISNSLNNLNLKEVKLTTKEIEKFYYGLSNKCIWPLFHYFIELSLIHI